MDMAAFTAFQTFAENIYQISDRSAGELARILQYENWSDKSARKMKTPLKNHVIV
jgi:hypothetical protein